MVYQTELKSGTYVYVNTQTNAVMTGTPENGKLGSAPCTIADANQHYRVEFNEKGDSAIIQHVKTGLYIGYSGTKLVNKSSKWCVFHKDDMMAFYMHNNGKTYILWPDMLDGYAGLMQAPDVIDQTPTALIPISVATGLQETAYTCHPESPQGFETVSSERKDGNGELIIPFGIYEIRIQNGKKSLRLKE